MVEPPETTHGKNAVLAEIRQRAVGRKPSRIDGIPRTPKAEQAINEAFALCFKGSQGKTVLAYLASITVNRINGPDAVNPNTLIHQEGGRYVYGVIKARVDLGRRKR